MSQKIQDIIRESIDVKGRVLNDAKLIGAVGDIVSLIVGRFREGRHLYFCGNGGSAADAQHLAAKSRAGSISIGMRCLRRRCIATHPT